MPFKLNDDMTLIHAVVIPNLEICLNNPNIKRIAKEFKNKGHKLADESLLQLVNDDISIDLLLGSESSYLIPEKDILFANNQSVFSETPYGVLIKGDINKILKNIKSIPSK